MKKFFKDKSIVVIGGTGTIGRKIIEMLLSYEPKVIRIFSRDEYKQFLMQNEFSNNHKLRFLIGDVRDYERVERATSGIDFIFHLAAMKHVPASEYNPYEAVKTNVLGTQNVITAAIANNVERVVFTSSDKAISPTNAMGATKLLAEKLIASANYSHGTKKTIFSAVRFGNVMGSRGSVIPLFKKQIIEENRITLTNGDMSRFMMSVTEAAKLTMKAAMIANGGEIFVLKMPVLKLKDLSEIIIEEVCKLNDILIDSIKVKEIGLRPGEKMYEELMTEEESRLAYELNDMFAIIPPFQEYNYKTLYQGYKRAIVKEYSSMDQVHMNKEEIRNLITSESLLDN